MSGVIEKVPYEVGSECHKVSVKRIAVMIDKGELEFGGCPGTCRFCGADLGVKHQMIDLGMGKPTKFPVLQCGRVTALYEEATRVLEGWKLERRKLALEEKAKSGKGKERERLEY